MRKSLGHAAWGLSAAIAVAGPAMAQYGARLPGQSPPSTPTIVSYTGTSPTTPVAAPSPLPLTTRANGSYYTPDVPKGYVLQPTPKAAAAPTADGLRQVSHATLTSSNAALPAGYVLQPVDEQTMTSAESESHTKLEEMKVDLALLSDPATFACHLSAKLDGRAILVRGFVPNEAVRDRALQLAQSATHMTIADGLNLHPTLAMRSAGVPAASLQSGAAELLVTGFPEVAHGIEAKANITGQVTLTGSARSFEEKLAMSQRMLRLNGCTSVVNRVKVTPILRNGTSLTMVTADGMHVVPTEVAMGQPSASAAPNMPEVRVLSSTQGTGTIHAMQAPPAVPRPVQLSKPVESSSMVRPLPAGPAFPRDKGSNNPHSGVSQGLVTFSE